MKLTQKPHIRFREGLWEIHFLLGYIIKTHQIYYRNTFAAAYVAAKDQYNTYYRKQS